MAYRIGTTTDAQLQNLDISNEKQLPLSACLPRPLDGAKIAGDLNTVRELLEGVRTSLEKDDHSFESRIESVRDVKNTVAKVADAHAKAAEAYRKAATVLEELSGAYSGVAENYGEDARSFDFYLMHKAVSSDLITCMDVAGQPVPHFFPPDLLPL
ncbi:hypothetical protein ACFQU1_15830 [Chelatococcus sp. GCM10030263]|uniref:hypothetical protein n=1 Tax=Chelatococcus sp. GCM10030263 TaxID=3273387 RepID=UPI003606B24B